MRSRRLVSLPLVMLALSACAGPEPAGVGEPCEQSTDCEASLSCVVGRRNRPRSPRRARRRLHRPHDDPRRVPRWARRGSPERGVELLGPPGVPEQRRGRAPHDHDRRRRV